MGATAYQRMWNSGTSWWGRSCRIGTRTDRKRKDGLAPGAAARESVTHPERHIVMCLVLRVHLLQEDLLDLGGADPLHVGAALGGGPVFQGHALQATVAVGPARVRG